MPHLLPQWCWLVIRGLTHLCHFFSSYTSCSSPQHQSQTYNSVTCKIPYSIPSSKNSRTAHRCEICLMHITILAVRRWLCAAQQGEDARPNNHVTETGKQRDKCRLTSPSRVCLAALKARWATWRKVTYSKEKRANHWHLPKSAIPVGYTWLYSDLNLCREAKRRI